MVFEKQYKDHQLHIQNKTNKYIVKFGSMLPLANIEDWDYICTCVTGYLKW